MTRLSKNKTPSTTKTAGGKAAIEKCITDHAPFDVDTARGMDAIHYYNKDELGPEIVATVSRWSLKDGEKEIAAYDVGERP